MAANIFHISDMQGHESKDNIVNSLNELDYVDSVDMNMAKPQVIIRSDHKFTVDEVENIFKEKGYPYKVHDTTFNE